MTARSSHGRAAVLVGLAGALLGTHCGPEDNKTTVWLEPLVTSVPAGTVFTVDVVADVTKGSLQAFELSLGTDIASVAVYNVLPHAEFDDDGGLFLAPDFDHVNGTVTRVVDLRHGEPLPTGEVRLATLQVFAHTPGSSAIQLTKTALAADGGAPVSVSKLSASVEVTP